MRRWLLILSLLLLTAPAAADAAGPATTRLSSTPEGLRAGRAWRVQLTILQPGRAPRADLRPQIVIRDADGYPTTFPAHPLPRPGHYAATVRFPKPGQWSYAVRSGLPGAAAVNYPAVVIRPPPPATTVRRPDPVGPTALPIVLAGVLALGAGAVWLSRRRRHPPARLA